MFPDKSPIEAGDACTTVNKSAGVDGFQGVQWFNKLNRDLHRWGSFYMNRGTLCARENLHQRSFLIQKPIVEKEILLTFSSSSLLSTGSSLDRSSTTCWTLGDPFLKLGHLVLRCLGSWKWKQSPFSIHLLHSSAESLPTLIMSMSMASGSQVLVGVEKDWEDWWVGLKRSHRHVPIGFGRRWLSHTNYRWWRGLCPWTCCVA